MVLLVEIFPDIPPGRFVGFQGLRSNKRVDAGRFETAGFNQGNSAFPP